MMKNVNLQLPAELLARVDEAVGDVPRNRWIRRAIEQALSEAKEPIAWTQSDPGSVPSSEGVRSAAPAERPEWEGLPVETDERMRRGRVGVAYDWPAVTPEDDEDIGHIYRRPPRPGDLALCGHRWTPDEGAAVHANPGSPDCERCVALQGGGR